MSSVAQQAMAMWKEVGRIFRRFPMRASGSGPGWQSVDYEIGELSVDDLQRQLARIGKIRPLERPVILHAELNHIFRFSIQFSVPKEDQRDTDIHTTARASVLVYGGMGREYLARVTVNRPWIRSLRPEFLFSTAAQALRWDSSSILDRWLVPTRDWDRLRSQSRELQDAIESGVVYEKRERFAAYTSESDEWLNFYVEANYASTSATGRNVYWPAPLTHYRTYSFGKVSDAATITASYTLGEGSESPVDIVAFAPKTWWETPRLRTPFQGEMRATGIRFYGVGAQEEQVVVELVPVEPPAQLPSSISQVIMRSI